MLTGDRLRENGYFVPGVVAECLRRHRTGRVDVSQILNAVLGVQVWNEIFLRGESLSGAA